MMGGILFAAGVVIVFLFAALRADDAGVLAASSPVVLGAVRDATICSDNVNGSIAMGPLTAGATNSNGVRRALVLFDLSSITITPSQLSGASLVLKRSKGATPGSVALNVHRLTANWTVGSSSSSGGNCAAGTSMDVTYDYASFATRQWASQGGDYATLSSDTESVDSDNLISFDVRNDVAAMLAGSVANHGWIIIGEEGTPQSATQFMSMEMADGPALYLTSTGATQVASALMAAALALVAIVVL